MTNRFVAAVVFACLVVAPGDTRAQIDTGDLPVRAVEWLQDYIRIDTVNPPGNEIAGAQFLAAILEAEGISYEMVESAPGRGNIWARLEGGPDPGLVLLHHIDVVPADSNYWSIGPLSGEIRDGHMYGRGALDTKSSGIVHLAAFIALHRSGVALNRDVTFMATADEEAGGYFGVGWLVENRPELFDRVGYVINEGGGGVAVADRVQFSVEVTQKVPYWLRLTSRGQPGHGSRPQAATAVTRLVEALDRLRAHEFEPRVIPAVDTYFRRLAPGMGLEWRDHYANLEVAIQDPEVDAALLAQNPGHYGLTRNTCSMTRLEGSNKINVIPTEAWAELDCRLIPDQDPVAFLAELSEVLGDAIEVDILMGFTPAVSSSETGLFRTIEDVSETHFPGSNVVPAVLTAFTDSHFLRDLDIVAYGYDPFVVPVEHLSGVHGNDERISVQNIGRGVVMTLDLVERWAVD